MPRQGIGLCDSTIFLPGTHHVAESVRPSVLLASEEGAVMSCDVAPVSMEIIGHEINKIQVSKKRNGR